MAVTEVNFPSWTGKALGAAAALILGPQSATALVWWIAGGIALGHALDTLGPRALQTQRGIRPGRYADDRSSLRFTFAALGRVADAAELDQKHLDEAERLMARLAFNEARSTMALTWFHAGRDSAFPFDALGRACREEFAAHPVFESLAIQALCRMAALADSPRATTELLALGERVGWQREALASQAAAVAAALSEREPLARARAILGVGTGDGRELIRLAYRRRIARWLPERLPPDAPVEERMAAERRLEELRRALEVLLADTR